MTTTHDPLASVSGQFALAGSTPTPPAEKPSPLRPWGLRHTEPARGGTPIPEWTYDADRQIAVDSNGRPLIEGPEAKGQPTANTTTRVDGEDPPSSEDWHND
ncbi:MAG: putative ATP-grasp-modified RiPP [Pseudonocardiaceae bacterium]|nr:putative ATP-grasp-modified RiPP [Pseudonocardiaceae bacterium]